MLAISLSNGIKMPLLGFGVFKIPNSHECQLVVEQALDTGYRLIDTAQAYLNEESVGRGIKNSGVPREEIFLTSKVWISNSGESKAYQSILDSLKTLNTDYIDLMLIHQPFGDYYGTYRALERALSEGKCRSIGVSNFFADRFVDLCNHVNVMPHVNQMETHAFNQQMSLRPYLDKYKTQLESWGPLAEAQANFFTNPVLTKLASKYQKTVAQVGLRFLVQSGIVVIPKTVHKERMEENINIFDFSISNADMDLIRGLDTGRSFFCDHNDPEFVQALNDYKI